MGGMNAPLVILDNLAAVLTREELPHSTIYTYDVYEWAAQIPLTAEQRLERIVEATDGVHE